MKALWDGERWDGEGSDWLKRLCVCVGGSTDTLEPLVGRKVGVQGCVVWCGVGVCVVGCCV